ncbi:hypothetical protein SAPIO_CDS8744 [Scedosporium apiospermum]|uniref:XTP/dITP diphosphatase n=1 Tax=Pseudallescheria apiosperma TaxID=563466 RepID=A0A084FYT8_PSEDA|nr:uncharacterized protein SAPIO_CDS8744 [Scedosporium apiospermum]KEZ40250.1 hypothetical protein SAPIO_CDS8744 [Scedosporium apiospermum]
MTSAEAKKANIPLTPVVNFITGNSNKLREVRGILESSIQVQSHELDIEEIQGSIEEIAIAKCKKAADLLNSPVLVEDTALCFNALNGLPGPYIKWFLRDLGNEGLSKLLAGFPDKSAEAYHLEALKISVGFNNNIASLPRDINVTPSTGWDPCFEHKGQTYAEMRPEEKNKISHRALALGKLQEWFVEHQP